MTTKEMLGLSVAGGRKEERLRLDHIWSIGCREEFVPERGVRRIPHPVRAPWPAPVELPATLSEVYDSVNSIRWSRPLGRHILAKRGSRDLRKLLWMPQPPLLTE
jgi:hypothetical protein